MAGTRISPWLKRLDRYAGIPALLPFALQPKRPFDKRFVRRIGLMKTAAIGDTLLLAGLVEDIRRTYPGAALVFITGPDNRSAVELVSPGAEHVVVSPHHPVQAIRSIRRARLDVIVDFGAWPRFDALLASLSGARYRVGFRTPGQLRHLGFDLSVEHSNLLHERDNYVALAAAIGVRVEATPQLHPAGILREDRLPARPYAVFHPWSSGFMHEVKEWSNERWIDLARALVGRNWTFVLTGGASERLKTEALAEQFRASGLGVVNCAGAFTVPELSDVLVNSDVVVSVNTGVMHLAALVGACTVSLEGPTPPLRWRALGPRARAVVTEFPNCGYLNLGFEYAGQRLDCMAGIPVSAVVAAINDLVPVMAEENR